MGAKRAVLWWIVGILALGLVAGCAGAPAKPQASGAAPSACAAKIEKQIAPEAQLTELACFFKDYKKVKSLHIKVGIKNVTNKPHRYRVNLFLDNGKAVGGLIPRKGKPPVVKPGEVATFTYPVKGMAERPGALTVIVKTIGD